MRAVVALNGVLTCEEMPDPRPGVGEVLVRTLSCGICGSDLHALHHLPRVVELGRRCDGMGADLDPRQGVVFGHEFSAELLDYGPDCRRSLKRGARVVSMPVVLAPGRASTVGYSNQYPGGFAERMVLTESLLLEVPNGLDPRRAAMTEPFAVGAHAVARAALDEPSAALVVGCGPVGLAVIAALKARGYGPVTAADYSADRRRMAEIMDADLVVDPAEVSPHTKWAEMGVAGTGAEQMIARRMGQPVRRAIIFECVGLPGVLASIVEGAPANAQVIVAGVCVEPDTFEPYICVQKQIDLRFVISYTRSEFAQTLSAIAEGQLNVEPIITDAVGLEDVAGAFERLAKGEGIKIVVEPSLG